MNNTLLATWHLKAQSSFTTLVIPDGCRDLIFKHPVGEKPSWFVSSLSDHTYDVEMAKGDVFTGYRLRPGTNVDETKIIAAVKGEELTLDDVGSVLESYTTLSDQLSEALDCLATGIKGVALAADQLGVSRRSLQRLLLQETGRSPVYWLQLARVRRAGRAVQETSSLAEIAYDNGFADQSHMNREFMRWLAITPSVLRTGAVQSKQLGGSGFA